MKIIAGIAGIAVLGLAALGFWFYAPDKSRAELEARYSGDYLTVEDVRLRLRDSGPRDAPAVILLHGFGASLETWEPWAEALSARFRVIRFDLPGFGLTGPDPTGDYTDERTMQILAALMDQLGLEQASLIGNSLGGRLAWTFAAQHPQRVARLVLVSPDGFASPGFTYGEPPEVPMMMQALPYVAPRSMLRANLAAAYADPDTMTEEMLTRYRDLLLAPGVRQAILDRTEQTILRDPVPLLAQITAPTLLLWGEEDGMIPVSNSEDYLQHMPDARVVRLPGLGHLPFEEAPATSLAQVERFLQEETP